MTDNGPRRIKRHAFMSKPSTTPGSHYPPYNPLGCYTCGLPYESEVHWILAEDTTPLEDEDEAETTDGPELINADDWNAFLQRVEALEHILLDIPREETINLTDERVETCLHCGASMTHRIYCTSPLFSPTVPR